MNMDNNSNNKTELESVIWRIEPIKIGDADKDSSTTKDGASEAVNEKTIYKFRNIAQKFVTLLELYWQYKDAIGPVAEKTSLLNSVKMPDLFLEIQRRNKEADPNEKPIAKIVLILKRKGEEKEKEISAPIFEYKHIKQFRENTKYHNKATLFLHETVHQQMVNAWERMLADLLDWKFRNTPEIIPQEKTIPYSAILTFKDLKDVQNYLIEEETTDFLRRKPTLDQIRYFKDEFKVDIESVFPYVADLCEIILRRHVIVHAGGIANSEYINKTSKLKKLTIKIPKEGSILSEDPDYLSRSWCIIYAAGVILLHLLAVNHARNKNSQDDENEADNFLINSAYNAIKNEQYFAAELVLQYATKRRLTKEGSDLKNRINLAQTYKWQGRDKECTKLLDQFDVPACSALYRLCIATLRDDFKAFSTNLKIAQQEGSIKGDDLNEWPVFKEIRGHEKFKGLFKDVFGFDFNSIADRKQVKLLNFESEKELLTLNNEFAA